MDKMPFFYNLAENLLNVSYALVQSDQAYPLTEIMDPLVRINRGKHLDGTV